MLFHSDKTVFFLTGFCLLCFSIISFLYNKERLTIALLITSAFFVYGFAALYYPYLNIWDERFHALVGKNLMNHPLMPTLYDDPVVNMVYNDNWARYNIWVHKQPLFMWQIALSFKLFGINEFTMRLPNILLGTLMIYAAYRSGTILKNKTVGYITAVLMVTSSHLMQIVSGRLGLDQNDFSFVSYISLSIWSWLEYENTKKKYWIILIGLFSGCALLCKWLVGLLVYLCWGTFSAWENKLKIKNYKNIVIALAVTAAVFVPWQIFILLWYPNEAIASFKFNVDHFTTASDGHNGSLLYHIDLIGNHYGTWVPYIIIPALILFCLRSNNKKITASLVIGVVFVYLFFSLATTKMPCFTTVVALPVFISLAFLTDYVLQLFEEKVEWFSGFRKSILFVSLFFLFFVRIGFITYLHLGYFPGLGDEKYFYNTFSHNKNIFQKLKLPSNTVVFNVPGKHYVEGMFYTNLPMYNIIPTKEQFFDLKQKNRIVAIFHTENNNIPDYLINDKRAIILNDTIFQCE